MGHGYIKGNAGAQRRFLEDKRESAAAQQRAAASVLERHCHVKDAGQFSGCEIGYG
jgi:hypothetical protein